MYHAHCATPRPTPSHRTFLNSAPSSRFVTCTHTHTHARTTHNTQRTLAIILQITSHPTRTDKALFVVSERGDNRNAQVRQMSALVSRLPPINQVVLKRTMHFLVVVSLHSHVNRMSASNLGKARDVSCCRNFVWWWGWGGWGW